MFNEVIELIGESSIGQNVVKSEVSMTDVKIKKKLEGIIDVDKKSSQYVTSF